MAPISSRIPFSPQRPFRPVRPQSTKIIFISCEGAVTEEEYFERLTDIYCEVKSKIQFVSVAEDAVNTKPKFRTPEQAVLLSKSRPKQLLERIEQFKETKNDIYQFSKYPEDEFWIISDVDKNWSDDIINAQLQKSYRDEWLDVVDQCAERGYGYAISNPFFEMWLLLHHDDPTEEDMKYAVTETHAYEKTSHFKTRLEELGYRIKDKHINKTDYTDQNVRDAVRRAEAMHLDKTDLYPKYYASTVYVLVKKLLELTAVN